MPRTTPAENARNERRHALHRALREFGLAILGDYELDADFALEFAANLKAYAYDATLCAIEIVEVSDTLPARYNSTIAQVKRYAVAAART